MSQIKRNVGGRKSAEIYNYDVLRFLQITSKNKIPELSKILVGRNFFCNVFIDKIFASNARGL